MECSATIACVNGAAAAPASRACRAVLLAVVVALLALGGGLAAQAQSVYQPEFAAEAVPFRAERGEGTRLDVHARIPHTAIRFVQREGGFEARYTLTVSAFRAGRGGRPDGLVSTRTWTREVTAPSYAATQADTLADRTALALELPPGAYVLRLDLEDGVSNRTARLELEAEVPDFTGELALSGLLLADRYDAATRTATPNVANVVPTEQAALAVVYEVYGRQPERLRVHYEVHREEGDQRRSLLSRLLRRGTPDPEPPVYASSDWLRLEQGRAREAVTVPTDRLPVGDYEIYVRLERPDGTVVAERAKPFSVRWSGLHLQIRDLDTAIAQLRYIAKDRELRAIREASTPEARLRLFQEFWDKRDPSPSTRRNERMEEYYYRIAHANRRYGGGSASGWSTDRGEVYVRFGEPDVVEDGTAGQGGRPHQIWHYNRIGRRFIFVDESGRGDFRLLAPIWDARTRM